MNLIERLIRFQHYWQIIHWITFGLRVFLHSLTLNNKTKTISVRSLKSEHVWVIFLLLLLMVSGQALNFKRYTKSFDLSGKFNLLLLIYKRLRTGSWRNLHVWQSSWVWTVRLVFTFHQCMNETKRNERLKRIIVLTACNVIYIIHHIIRRLISFDKMSFLKFWSEMYCGHRIYQTNMALVQMYFNRSFSKLYGSK